ncbi:MAG TPA: DUF2726 domain-containing protein [Tepidisphaeraceae bacterium]|jgi:hypothetical protein
MGQRRRADSEPSEFEELIEELIHGAAAYPWIGVVLAIVLFVIAAVLWRMGSYYPLFGALAGFCAVLFLVAAGIGSALRIVKGRRRPRVNAGPTGAGAAIGARWIASASLLTPGEAAFYPALEEAVGGRCLIFAKVRLCDLLQDLPSDLPDRADRLRRVAQMHVDFVLCDRLQYRPLLAIELDDASHARPDRAARDRELGDLLRQAGLRLERFPCEPAYDPRAIRERIDGREPQLRTVQR